MYNHLKSRTVDVIGAAFRHGQKHLGTEFGPEALRKGGLSDVIKNMNWNMNDKGDLKVENIQVDYCKDLSKYKYPNKIKNAEIVGSYNKHLSHLVKESADKRNFVLNLGGDHSVACGTISALRKSYTGLKVIWIDAHADINTPESTLSENYHGCPLGHLLGIAPKDSIPGFDWLDSCLDFKDIVYIGLRSVDIGEKKYLRDYNIKHFCMEDVTELGIGNVMKQTFDYFNKNQINDNGHNNYPLHISFDIDGIDGQFIQQTGTVCRGGLTDREAHHILRKSVQTGNLVSLDLVELNPLLGDENAKLIRPNSHGDFSYIKGTQTVCLSLELIQSALGYRVCL